MIFRWDATGGLIGMIILHHSTLITTNQTKTDKIYGFQSHTVDDDILKLLRIARDSLTSYVSSFSDKK